MRYMKFLQLYVFIFISCGMIAQTESKTSKESVYMTCLECDSLYNRICPENRIVFGDPEHSAEFPGGHKELLKFVKNTLQYPEECKEKAIQGRVIIKFIIDEFGEIVCLYVHKSLHPALDKEALRIVKLMPDWKPALNDRVPCKTCFTLPIHFKL